jgi:chemotaxis protein MotA
MLLVIAIAVGAIVAGIAATGVGLVYFFQPAGALIVLGGTLGVTLITTPCRGLLDCGRRVFGLFRPGSAGTPVGREELIEEIVAYNRSARTKGLFSIEASISGASYAFLRDALTLAMDVKNRSELQAALETKLRLRERQGEADARVLEVAGGFAPTIGVLGTVVGLIDVLRQFSSLSSVAFGIGTAFVSTIYGLALANPALLPAAHRIRATVAEAFETEEMIAEGALCLFDDLHPALLRERLNSFLRSADQT